MKRNELFRRAKNCRNTESLESRIEAVVLFSQATAATPAKLALFELLMIGDDAPLCYQGAL